MLCVRSAIVATDYVLDRRPLANWTRLEPELFCPGDTVTASYDFLTPDTCPTDARCSSFNMTDRSRVFVAVMAFAQNVPTSPDDFRL